jgi:hypothetical protein
MGPAWTTSLRSLTIRLMSSAKREKVKVLAVLYDGGKHADEVSLVSSPCIFPPTLHIETSICPSKQLEAPRAKSHQSFKSCKHSSTSISMRGRSRI